MQRSYCIEIDKFDMYHNFLDFIEHKIEIEIRPQH